MATYTDKTRQTAIVLGFVLSLGVGGCQTTGSTTSFDSSDTGDTSGATASGTSETSYALFYDQSDHLKELLDAPGKLDEASRLFDDHQAFFDVDREKYKALLERLAAVLNERHETSVDDASAALAAAIWPAPEGEWRRLRRAMSRARAALDDYPSSGILSEAQYRLPQLGDLDTKYEMLAKQLRDTASTQFEAFDHYGAIGFFENYPLTLESERFFAENYPSIAAEVEAGTMERIKGFAANYPKSIIGAAARDQLATAFMAAYQREPQARGGSRLAALLGSAAAASDAGFEPKEIPGLSIGLVEATSQTLLREGQIEFPVSLDIDMPVKTERVELDDAFGAPSGLGLDYLIVFEVALAKASRRVAGLDKKPSSFVSGHKTLNNPNYAVAQQEVQQAQMEMQNAAISSASTNAQYCYGMGCLGKAIAQVASAAVQGAAQEKLEEAMASLRTTPQTIEHPINQDYEFDVARITARKTMTVHYYILDPKAKTYFKAVFDIAELEKFNVAYRLHSKDPRKHTHAGNFDTEKEVDDFEKAESSVKLSQLINNYAGGDGTIRKFKGLQALRKEMLTDKNKALASFSANTYDARPLNDLRFDSVVAVYEGGGGMGSGFFVKPDVVLTNWHVVKDKQFVELKTYDGQETFGKVLGKDVRLDLALVRVQSRGKPIRFRTETRINLGATVEAIGHPRRLLFSITRGVVSAVRKHHSISLPKGAGDEVLYIQTDAPISPGNSGGPLFMGDYVIGINTWGRLDGQNLNFSVHYSEILTFLKEHLPGFRVLMN